MQAHTESRTPAASISTSSQPYGTAGSSEDFMQQMMEITKQQSETARRQTELLEKESSNKPPTVEELPQALRKTHLSSHLHL